MERANEPTTSRGRYYEAQETVVPTGAGLRTAGVTEEIYVQAGAVSEALSFADIDKPLGAGGERFYIDPLGHEEDLV